MTFKNRSDAGRKLARALIGYKDQHPVILALPRGGVVVAAEIAVMKAGEHARGGSAASDAFFPFADGLESLTDAGVTSVVQPGGSVRDQDVVDAANRAGIVMMMTGERHFRH